MIASTSLFSQTSYDGKLVDKMTRELDNREFIEGSREVKINSNISGSPYLNDSFLSGIVYSKKQEEIAGQYRFNIYADEIEFIKDEKIYSITQLDKYNYFTIGDNKFFYQSYMDGEKTKKGFMIVLAEGNYSLFLKKKIVYMPEEQGQPYTIPKPNRFEPGEDSYYIASKSDPAKKITSIKELKKAFPEIVPMIDSYKESKNLKKKKSLINLVNYLNSKTI